MSYITKDDTIIFSFDFNSKLNIELISNYKKVIFSNYKLYDELFEHYEGKINYIYDYEGIFNKTVNDLPNSITHLIFGHHFNQYIYKFPDNLTQLTFDYCFDNCVDNLPNGLIYLKFGWCFNKPISVLTYLWKVVWNLT